MQDTYDSITSGPEISVILPVYNGMNYLPDAVASVLMQQDANFELLIIDDCSDDGSREWLQKIQDDRVELFFNESNKGLFYNLNFLASRVNSPLIKLWAQDDVMTPGCLRGFIAFHQKFSGLGYSYCMREIIDENGNLSGIHQEDTTPELIDPALHAKLSYLAGSLPGNIANVCIVRAAFEERGGFNERMKISADFDMWVRLGIKYPTGFLRQKLVRIRDHSGQLSRSKKSYLLHVEEDLCVYNYLDKAVERSISKEGRLMLRNRKLMFYFTLMLKSLKSGHIPYFIRYFKSISSYDNIFTLSFLYLRKAFMGRKTIGS